MIGNNIYTKYKKMIIFPLLFFMVAAAVMCDKPRLYRERKLLLGTEITLSAIAPSPGKAEEVFSLVFEEIARIEQVMSPYREASDVVLLNTKGADNPVQVRKETYDLLKRSYAISEETRGAFDITFATVGELWNFKNEPFAPPAEWRVKRKIRLVDYRYLQFNDHDNSVLVGKRGIKIGLGGIAKGYAIQRGIEIFKQHGFVDGIVEAGGDLEVMGSKFGQPWKAGLVHPRKNQVILLSLTLRNDEAVATSGDYERFAMYKGKRYHHILDPRTGFPANTFASVTILCKSAVDADAYATAIFVMGLQKARMFLKERQDLKAVMVMPDMKIYASKALKETIAPLEEGIDIHWLE